MCRRRFWLAALALTLSAALAPVAQARIMLDGVPIDPADRVRPALLERALVAWKANPDTRRDILAVVDFAAASTAARLFLIDLVTGDVQPYLTAHGRGSDPDHIGRPEKFSNEANSKASSLGAYRTAERYHGQHGLSLALDGLEESDSQARSRAIVIHSAQYMTPSYIRRHGKPGRSWGCFVVDPAHIAVVVDRLEGGVLLYAGR